MKIVAPYKVRYKIVIPTLILFFTGLRSYGFSYQIHQEQKKIFCTGSFISPIHILTAAHCFQDISLGQPFSITERQKLDLKQVRIHPIFKLWIKNLTETGQKNMPDLISQNDLAIIELNSAHESSSSSYSNTQTISLVPRLKAVKDTQWLQKCQASLHKKIIHPEHLQMEIRSFLSDIYLVQNMDKKDPNMVSPGDSGSGLTCQIDHQEFLIGIAVETFWEGFDHYQSRWLVLTPRLKDWVTTISTSTSSSNNNWQSFEKEQAWLLSVLNTYHEHLPNLKLNQYLNSIKKITFNKLDSVETSENKFMQILNLWKITEDVIEKHLIH